MSSTIPHHPIPEDNSHEPSPLPRKRKPTTAKPINWPPSLTYLDRPTHSPHIPPSTLATLNKPTKATSTYHKLSISDIPFPNPSVQITPITNPAHPAFSETGLFAAIRLAPNSLILPYIGHMHTNSPDDTDPTSSYDISLDRDLAISIDAAHAGNEARSVNDYRGVADRPNAEFRDMWVRLGEKKWERWIGVFVVGVGKAGLRKKGIARGEEILVSYGKGFWAERRRVERGVLDVVTLGASDVEDESRDWRNQGEGEEEGNCGDDDDDDDDDGR